MPGLRRIAFLLARGRITERMRFSLALSRVGTWIDKWTVVNNEHVQTVTRLSDLQTRVSLGCRDNVLNYRIDHPINQSVRQTTIASTAACTHRDRFTMGIQTKRLNNEYTEYLWL